MNRRKALHITVAVFWTVAIIPALIWWPNSVLFVIFASVWANVYSAMAAMEAANDSLTETDKQWITEEITRLLEQAEDKEVANE